LACVGIILKAAREASNKQADGQIRQRCWLIRPSGVSFGVGSLGRVAQQLTTPKSLRMIRTLAAGIQLDH